MGEAGGFAQSQGHCQFGCASYGHRQQLAEPPGIQQLWPKPSQLVAGGLIATPPACAVRDGYSRPATSKAAKRTYWQTHRNLDRDDDDTARESQFRIRPVPAEVSHIGSGRITQRVVYGMDLVQRTGATNPAQERPAQQTSSKPRWRSHLDAYGRHQSRRWLSDCKLEKSPPESL